MNRSLPPGRDWPTERDQEVQEADVKRLDVIHSILATLNDPEASANKLAASTRALPVLRARIGARFRARYPSRKVLPALAEQIALLGNRELEVLLLALLEDLMEFASVLQDDPPPEVGD